MEGYPYGGNGAAKAGSDGLGVDQDLEGLCIYLGGGLDAPIEGGDVCEIDGRAVANVKGSPASEHLLATLEKVDHSRPVMLPPRYPRTVGEQLQVLEGEGEQRSIGT
jgi:hypothetical protein